MPGQLTQAVKNILKSIKQISCVPQVGAVQMNLDRVFFLFLLFYLLHPCRVYSLWTSGYSWAKNTQVEERRQKTQQPKIITPYTVWRKSEGSNKIWAQTRLRSHVTLQSKINSDSPKGEDWKGSLAIHDPS